MKIGACNYPGGSICEEIKWIGENKFDFIDLFLMEDGPTPKKIEINKIVKLLRKYKLGAVGHTAWYLPFGTSIKSIRQAAIEECVKYFPYFSEAGARYVTVHANWPSRLFSDDEGIEFQVESLKHLAEIAAGFGLEIMYEHTDTPKDTVENAAKILSKVPEVYFHLDFGHASVYGRKPEDFIKAFHSKLVHVHIHESKRNMDLHLPLGVGDTDTESAVRCLKKYYNGTITLEIFSRYRENIFLSREILKKIWSK
ncbi:MAG: sugar phosphate isomerase/epimerase family protein [Candidatus Firestonebacteria bacterium]